ncbi:hypothetical protein [Mycoplasma sp. 1018B]|uniref:hypothetical protein n=1 Tax=Mycoplasma sp. 1018B TaxID=2967302 RepID=UPI00211CDCFC|nr:hypothetical protein [Mycoplasma sp. 1018B]UUM19212.1 hypothetical protein NPA14_02700 [Mycoplasma sp. 1018B]
MKKPSLLFILDNPNWDIKNELVNIKNICKKYNITLIFITNRYSLLDENLFEQMYLFSQNRELEYGNTNKILNNSFYSFNKEQNTNNYYLTKNMKLSEYFLTDNYEISTQHYVITNYNNIVNSIQNKDIETISFAFTSEADLNQKTQYYNYDLQNPLENTSFFIAKQDKNKQT